jgi:hypothetical protein
MYLESEVYTLLPLAFWTIIVLYAFAIGFFCKKHKSRSALLFLGQIIFLCLSFRYFYVAIQYLPNSGDFMYSEKQSLNLGISGVCWATSVYFSAHAFVKVLSEKK